MKQFRVTVRFRMNWGHFDSSLTDYVMNRLKNEMAQHIDKLEIERVEPVEGFNRDELSKMFGKDD